VGDNEVENWREEAVKKTSIGYRGKALGKALVTATKSSPPLSSNRSSAFPNISDEDDNDDDSDDR
jgi:hypothetical protein